MKSESWRTMGATQLCVLLIVTTSVRGVPHWPTEELLDRRYHNVHSENTEVTSDSKSSPDIGNDNYEASDSTTILPPKKESEPKSTKPRWSTRRRLSDREAVAVMEEELERREAAKTKPKDKSSRKRKEPKKSNAETSPGSSDSDSATAAANRRSGHHQGVTGPVHTFVKTDKHGHYKWGVRHHAGHM